MGIAVTSKSDQTLDITQEVCPLTFVKAKLAVERMAPGEVLEIRLKGDEPLENVPRSLIDLGHEILSVEPEGTDAATGVHIMRVRKTAGDAG